LRHRSYFDGHEPRIWIITVHMITLRCLTCLYHYEITLETRTCLRSKAAVYCTRILHSIVGSREIRHLIQMPQDPLSHLPCINIPMVKSIDQSGR